MFVEFLRSKSMILRDRDGSLLPFAKGSSRVNFPRIVPSIVDFLVCSLFRTLCPEETKTAQTYRPSGEKRIVKLYNLAIRYNAFTFNTFRLTLTCSKCTTNNRVKPLTLLVSDSKTNVLNKGKEQFNSLLLKFMNMIGY